MMNRTVDRWLFGMTTMFNAWPFFVAAVQVDGLYEAGVLLRLGYDSVLLNPTDLEMQEHCDVLIATGVHPPWYVTAVSCTRGLECVLRPIILWFPNSLIQRCLYGAGFFFSSMPCYPVPTGHPPTTGNRLRVLEKLAVTCHLVTADYLSLTGRLSSVQCCWSIVLAQVSGVVFFW